MNFSRNRRGLLLLALILLLLLPFAVHAQDVTDEPAPTLEATVAPVVTDVPPVVEQPPVVIDPTVPAAFDLQAVLASGIAFLLYTLTLAGAVQIAINQVKPLFLDPVKNRNEAPTDGTPDNVYLVYLYFFRAALTSVAYFYLWGGVAATRAVVPLLPAFVPDPGIAIVTIALVVLGEEIIHPLLDRLYALRDAAKLLSEPFTPLESAALVNITMPPGSAAAGTNTRTDIELPANA